MKESVIYTIKALYRDDFRVKAYTFGQGEKALCIVGNFRGNEYQQVYICSQMVRRLKELEAEGRLVEGKEVMVIPSVNPSSMNIGKRFWAIDNTDINRMFPGYDQGETTQRIAAGVFDVISKYQNGIQLTSFYMPGDFSPHVRVMRTGYENTEKARDFGLPYIVVRDPRPYDTATLNYNWQIWETDAYSLYSNTTGRIDEESAQRTIESMERFMILNGILNGKAGKVKPARLFEYDEMRSIKPENSGIFRNFVEADEYVEAGKLCAEVVDPSTGEVLEELRSPVSGTVFFRHTDALIYAFTSAFKILPEETDT